jgi:hypothetical protein
VSEAEQAGQSLRPDSVDDGSARVRGGHVRLGGGGFKRTGGGRKGSLGARASVAVDVSCGGGGDGDEGN